MAVSTAGSTTTTTTVLSKHDELAEIVGILADSSISAERYTRLELLVDMVADSSGKSDEHIADLKKQVKANADHLKQIISKEKELDDKCATFQAMVVEKTKKKNSKTQRVFDTQLLALNAMSNECKTYKANLHDMSTAINNEFRESVFQIINVYLTTELELQLSNNKLNSAAANNSETQQSSWPTFGTNDRRLPFLRCVLIGDVDTGKTTILQSYKERKIVYKTQSTFENFELAELFVDGVRYRLQIWDVSGNKRFDEIQSYWCKIVDVVLICFRTNEPGDGASYWIQQVRQHWCCPTTPIVLVDTTNRALDSKIYSTSFSYAEDGML
jgi:hypothetical protein